MELVDVNGCKRNLVVEVPQERVDDEIQKLAKKYAKGAKVPGFRPGKTPLSVITTRFASELRNDATQDLISEYWKSAVDEYSLKPLAEPVVERVDSKAGESLKFTVSFETVPDVSIEDYKGIATEVAAPNVTDEEVDAALERLREQSAQFVPVEATEVQEGHFVTLTLDGQIEGVVKPIHQDDFLCVVGSSEIPKSFSDNLMGTTVGDIRDFDETYPDDYNNPRFAGKTVHYHIEVKDVKEKQLPELNDEFAKDIGSTGSLEELRTKIRADLITNANEDAEKKAGNAVLDQLIEHHTFDIPECLVEDELRAKARRIASNLASQGIDVEKTSIDWNKMFEEERPQAQRAVHGRLILDAIAHQESLEPTDEELENELRGLSKETGKSTAALRAQLEKDNRIQAFKENMRQKKALDFIVRNANISHG